MARKRRPQRTGKTLALLRRRPGTRTPRSHILIVCEGSETEPRYFEALRQKLKLSSIEVEIEGKQSATAPLSVVNFAIRRRTEKIKEAKRSVSTAEYDEVWCVIDVENPTHNPTFPEAIQKAKSEKLELAVSNPAFEFWYLLHYEDTTRPFNNGQEVKRALLTYVPDYTESKEMLETLFEMTDEAIRRAKRIISSHVDTTPFPNPSTLVHELVEKLRSLVTY